MGQTLTKHTGTRHTGGTEAHKRHTGTQAALPCCMCVAHIINIQVNKGVEYIHSSAFYEYHALNLNSKLSIGWGLFAGGWVGPEWRGGVSPATLALMMMFVLFVSNTMFCVDRLHKLVAAQCACCSDFLGNAMRLFST